MDNVTLYLNRSKIKNAGIKEFEVNTKESLPKFYNDIQARGNGKIKKMWVDIILDRALSKIMVELRKEFKYKKRCRNRSTLYQKRIKQGRKGK